MIKNKSTIYTKKGDNGITSLSYKKRVLKSNIQVEAYGTIDELNSFTGLLRDKTPQYKYTLLRIQNCLFLIGAHLAAAGSSDKTMELPGLYEAELTFLEDEIDKIDSDLPKLTNFIIPGGHPDNSLAHICRTVARRAERIIVKLNSQKKLNPFIISYLNRLSDYFFVLARKILQLNNIKETLWERYKRH